jgi:hypothetical protein
MDPNFKAKPKYLARLLVRAKPQQSNDENRYRQKLNRALRTGLIVLDIDSKTEARSRRRNFDISASDVVTFAFVLLCLAAAILPILVISRMVL